MSKQLRICLLAAMVGCAMLLSGCEGNVKFTFNPQDLYALPELSAQYKELNSQLSAILNEGAEYAAPTAGTNVQPVQMVDLNGDGAEESIAFFRNAAEEKPLKIYIFSARDGGYAPAAVIEGSGSAISSIAYSDLNGDGRTELVVGWRVNTDLQALSVYALGNGGTVELLKSVNYVKYAITDLDRDGYQELVILRADGEGGGIADYYSWKPGGAIQQSTATVSMTMAELSRQGRLTRGTLADDTPALFITGVTDQNDAVTDILALREGELDNILLSGLTGVSRMICDFCSLYPTDLNGDGATEVPQPVELPVWGEGASTYSRIDWQQFSSDGTAETVLRTYHDIESSWYLRLPQEWTDQITVSRSAMSDETIVTFYILGGEGETPQPFLRISAISGANRDIKALRGNRFILSRQLDTSYTAELLEANNTWEYGLIPDEVRAAFSLIAVEWTSGE